MKISFSKTPDGVIHFSVNGNREWHTVDSNQYTFENMKLYIGGETDLPTIGHWPSAGGKVKNLVLEEIFKPKPRI